MNPPLNKNETRNFNPVTLFIVWNLELVVWNLFEI